MDVFFYVLKQISEAEVEVLDRNIERSLRGPEIIHKETWIVV